MQSQMQPMQQVAAAVAVVAVAYATHVALNNKKTFIKLKKNIVAVSVSVSVKA